VSSTFLLLAPAAAAAFALFALFALAAWRPAPACALLALAIPLTAGLPRGFLVPLLRVNEALLLVVAAGFLLHFVTQRRPLRFTGLDVVVLAFCTTGVAVASAVVLLTRAPVELADWVVVVGPIQYLVVYLVFSRTGFTPADLRLLLNACMLASLPVAAVALAETLDLPGVRDLFGAYYPGLPLKPGEVYRPDSLLGHYSAVGAFGLLNVVLALALAAMRHPGFSPLWLTVVIGANLLSMLSSQTYAPLAVLPLAAGVVVLAGGRLPWRALAGGVPVLGASAVVLWPQISGRIAAQFSGAGGGLGIPETMQTRIDFWQGFFLPALLRHGPWLGTGTVIPPEVPRPLVEFVDNGYLAQLFRAGVPGLAMLLALLGAVAAAGWAARTSPDPTRRVLGAVCLAAVVSVVLLSVTAEYLTFTAVSQEFWMLTGLLAGTLLVTQAASTGGVIVLRPQAAQAPERPARVARAPSRLAGAVRRLGPERVLVRASLGVLVGFGLARALGLLFQVAAGRLLPVDGYGRLMYALAVANVAAVLLTTAPLGLSRFLSRREGNRAEQEAYYVNWLAVVGLLLGLSAAVTAIVAAPLGLGGWLLVGLLANLVGMATLETYREVQRGLGRYTLQSAFYVLANALQLAAILLAAAAGWRSPALFLTIYGLSSVAALALLAPLGGGPRLARSALRWSRMRNIGGFMRPVLLQALFWNAWFNVDLILVQHLRTAAETGTYGAAKTIANGFTLVPTALAFVLAPRVARLPEHEVRGHVLRALALTLAVTVPLAAAVTAIAGPLTAALYGGRYAAAAVPLAVLVAAMVPYGLKTVFGAMWLGLGRPVVETASSGAGFAVTLALGLWLIPAGGAVAAAVAFGAGALAQLLVDGAVATWAFGSRSPRLSHLRDDRLLEARPAGRRGEVGAVLVARVRRLAVDWCGWPRQLLWGRRLGYAPRQPSTARISAVEEVTPAARSDGEAAGPAGLVGRPGPGPAGLAEVAGFLGLPVEADCVAPTAHLVHRALAGRWPLLAGPAEALTALPETALASLVAFVHSGGTLYLDGLEEASNAALRALAGRLGFAPAEVRAVARADHLLFPGEQPGFARELAGAEVETSGGPRVLAAPGAEVLALHVARGMARPAVVRYRAGEGHVLASTVPRPDRPLAEVATSGELAGALVPLLLLRSLYGAGCWHAPAPLANFSVDDPALRSGLLGLPYERLVALAGEHRFHVTIATVPRELPLADEPVVQLLRERPDLLSACYHGCDHAGYEFYRTGGSRLRHAVRPLEEQRRALERAVEHERAFAAAHGHRLDRVMVFPYGVGPAAIFPDLDRLGFLATCNYGDKYPLEAPVPDEADLGLRPADLAWAGFPLLWRRGLEDGGCLLDLVLGRPLLVFAHRRALGRDFRPFVERAAAINRATRGAAAWVSLEEVARHAYLQRRDPADGWQVLMTASEACLHNPDPEPRTVTLTRPHLPDRLTFTVDGRPRGRRQPLRVTVPAGGTAVVRLAPAGGGGPGASRRCPVFPPASEP
jgi:O-antigen/teichoic acid export membrane protein